ncbi:hypothetical protein N9821_01900 [Akkermansiaceae bacterium]|nr:hypothetical protein [Akkermansiaceae bacterium]MDB4311464.1 hypothetical protein [bacterium]MDB4259002.1 hypothetical protein [Akkermansiaceae bacterium]MDB4259884.1 hypothetical protein [Akkermansiaceae bacterium]MDB4275292.1 hypothetical protein [Akkermansiaceae bacterium]
MMKIPPSKKIFIGSSLVVSAIVLQLMLQFVAMRSLGDLSDGMELVGSMENMDEKLDGIHRQVTTMAVGFGIAWILIVAGLTFFVLGVYQNCKATERLLASSEAD